LCLSKAVAAGMNPMDLRRGIQLAVDAVLEELKSITKNVTTAEEIAQVSGARFSRACRKLLLALCLDEHWILHEEPAWLRAALLRWFSSWQH
jgi:hypothetical protein